jgi:GAF domain-containing protein
VLPSGWTELVALLDGRPDADPLSRLQRLCELCASVACVTGVAVSLASASARSTVCATDEVAERLEELQDTVGEGPRVQALQGKRSVLVADLARERARWPGFAPGAWEAGVRAVFVLPLRMGALHLGALSLYRTESGPLAGEQYKDVRVLCEAAAVLLTLDQPGSETAAAFMWVVSDRSRFHPQVHQAVGATMVHLQVGPREAFARMCAHAYATNTMIGAVAEQILDRRLRLEPDGAG